MYLKPCEPAFDRMMLDSHERYYHNLDYFYHKRMLDIEKTEEEEAADREYLEQLHRGR